MNLFDFVFIAAFLFVVGSLLWIVAQWVRGHRAAAARHALSTARITRAVQVTNRLSMVMSIMRRNQSLVT